jgi:geranylgeranyl pyrophosphate synthase
MCAYVLNPHTEWLRSDAACVAQPLDMVEARLAEVVASEVNAASDVAFHLLEAGGKRVRPALVLLSAGAGGGNVCDPKVIDLAAAAELVHMGSLVHDDVVDETRERRGVPTASGKWGNKISVLGGDFLVAKAFLLLAAIGKPEVIEVLSSTAVRMTESEVLQAECEGDVHGWRANYWQIIKGKTAAFTAACCECGAILAEARPETRARLAAFGEDFGLAFQISDDLLDILGDSAETGKDVGTDLTQGKFTLPVLLALQHAAGPDQARLQSLLEPGFLSADQAREVLRIAVECGVTGMAREIALDYVENARASLGCLPYGIYTNALGTLAASVADRNA